MLNNLSEFLDHSNLILNDLKLQGQLPLHKSFLVENCLRTYDVLFCLETLLNSDLNDAEIEHPIGILLRSGLHDFINFQYVTNRCVEKEKLNQEKFILAACEYMNGHYNKIDPSLEIDEQFKHLERFKDFGNKKEYKILGILKEGKDFAKQKKLNFLGLAIDLWEWYSKYEHHGVFTLVMLKHEENKYRRNESIKLLLINVCLSLYTLAEIDSSILDFDTAKVLEEITMRSFND